MATTVTDEMVQAAYGKLPARWSMQDLHDAIAAAIQAAPPIELEFATELTDEQRQRFTDSFNQAAAARGPLARVYPATVELRGEHGPELLLPPVDGCVSSKLRTGGPVYAGPLAGVTEIATHLGVGRSTVAGWTKRAEKIGMPAPLAELAAGPVYSLDAVETWYHAWKNTEGGTDAAA